VLSSCRVGIAGTVAWLGKLLFLLAPRVGIELARNSLSFLEFIPLNSQHYPHYYPDEPRAAVTSNAQE
jgi:hypothetical protein